MGDSPQYAPGQQLAGTVYRVVRHLATGGMGSVYDVEDVTVGKRYVLKTLHPQLVSRHDLAKRMEAEARALAKLQHPNIVDVVTAGMTTDDQRMPFYVMERLNGQNLRVVIEKKGSLKLSHCYRIAIDVLDALEHAHENSVIHRDVKPENIFLHRNPNGTNTTKLLDFGIMRLLDRKASHTQGKFIGTLRYASPEQIFGGELGPPTDIYSLGIVLYEMIAGRGPFDDVGDAYAIGAAHAQMAPPSVAKFTAVPPQLERLVMSALAKSPQERPRDCFSFAAELRRMLREEENAPPPSATAVNVLTSMAPPTQGGLSLAGTEQSPPPSPPPGFTPPGYAPPGYAPPGYAPPPHGSGAAHGSPPPPVRAFGATEIGMIPPSNLDPQQGGNSLPATVRHGAGASGVSAARAPGAPGAPGSPSVPGATELGVAATLISQPGGDAGRAAAAAARIGSSPGMKPLVDRAAETRAGGLPGTTQRFAQNGTAIDDGADRLLPEEDVRAALAQRYPLEVPPASGQRNGEPSDDGRGELLFPRNHGYPQTGTGPLAGEARTRPPERSMILPLIGAAVFGAMLVGGAVLLVTKPWQRSAASAAPPAAMTPLPEGATSGSSTSASTPSTAMATVTATAAAAAARSTPPTAGGPGGPGGPGAPTTIAIAPAVTAAPQSPPAPPAPLAAPPSTSSTVPSNAATGKATTPRTSSVPAASASAGSKPARPAASPPRPEAIGFD